MVAGTPEGTAPSIGDKIQVVSAQGTKNGSIVDAVSMGGRVTYVLARANLKLPAGLCQLH